MNYTTVFLAIVVIALITIWWWRNNNSPAARANLSATIAQGKAFLEENEDRPEVVALPSGLQYEIIRKGTGVQPTLQDRVKVHYHGTLIDGTVFDSSVERGQPATFGVRQVIQGWQEGIPLMNVGSQYRLYIPQELAYGKQSPSHKIPAGSTLIFDVELLDVNP
jgi:FKBP-type peptidyl-prolyl cis-trans isomerase FklB